MSKKSIITTVQKESVPAVKVETTGLENVTAVSSPVVPTTASQKTDNLPSNSEESELIDQSAYEANLAEKILIDQTWLKIEKLFKAESINTWAIGDEMSVLYSHRLTYEDVAKRVARGKSYIESLVATSRYFKQSERNKSYSWWVHDLYRRAKARVDAKLQELGSEEFRKSLPNLTTEQFGERVKSFEVNITKFDMLFGLQAIGRDKSRNTRDAVNAIMSKMFHTNIIDKSQYDFMRADSTPAAKPQCVITVHNGKVDFKFDKNMSGQNVFSMHKMQVDALNLLISQASAQLADLEKHPPHPLTSGERQKMSEISPDAYPPKLVESPKLVEDVLPSEENLPDTTESGEVK